ncbi:hypothetical protein SAMN04488127_1014 [Bhargavaea ginsengi]|uniref:Uncharacterized protein n=1 Tax=Bhargavaea ginsengi TaxID=426757 RepID=A0A1H6V5X0_9BACL|nr:hypothetical protein [Bhargavaea ginsengi]SEI99918.1 hypothetical protein SAMN04488127_1014 [Bhargavaea ginsengi]
MQLIGMSILLIPILMFTFALEERGRKMMKRVEQMDNLGIEADAVNWVEEADDGEKWSSKELALGLTISLIGFGSYVFNMLLG